MRKNLLSLLLLSLPLFLAAQPKIQLANYVSGYIRPVDITHCGDSRLFIVEQDGVIRIIDSLGNKLSTPFLDINAKVNSSGNEQGLLGLAFHPEYAQNGWFYVYYIKNGGVGDTRVARYTRSATDPNVADPNSELTIIEATQPYSNHNGGCIKFGPDGYLYISIGDGGSGGDPQNNGQKKNTLLGKISRIDINSSSVAGNYTVPADNPFVNDPAYRPEIWSLGWRNVWRFSFDRLTGDMWLGDVGQNAREEIDFEPANTGGRNYGWRCLEGNQTYNNSGCLPSSNFTPPAYTYVNPSIGCSVTGGFIYRGAKYPDLYGVYLFADYCSGRVWGTRRNTDGTFTTNELANLGDYEFSAFGEDRDGELYVALLSSGKIQKVTELCSTFQIETTAIDSVNCDGPNGLVQVATTGGTGNINYAWSNGETGTNLIAYLYPGTYTVTATSGNGCTRTANYTMVSFGPQQPTIATDTLICSGQEIVLTIGNLNQLPANLNFYKDNTLISTVVANSNNYEAVFTNNGPGIYEVIVTDTACIQSALVAIDQEVALEPTLTFQSDTAFGPLGWAAYQWYRNGQPIVAATADFYIANTEGEYYLAVTSDNGCVYQSIPFIVLINTRTPASVRELTLSPNPTTDQVLLKLNLLQRQRISISMTDATGKQLFLQTHQSQELSLPIDLRILPAATYFLQIQLENGDVVQRQIVKR
jgi:glucose/arabinose dehydrogenase